MTITNPFTKQLSFVLGISCGLLVSYYGGNLIKDYERSLEIKTQECVERLQDIAENPVEFCTVPGFRDNFLDITDTFKDEKDWGLAVEIAQKIFLNRVYKNRLWTLHNTYRITDLDLAYQLTENACKEMPTPYK